MGSRRRAAGAAVPARESFRGCLLGLAVGDALGAPAEFLPREEMAARWGLLTEMVGGGVHDVAPGEVTDDTDMMLCLAESLAAQHGFAPADVARRYLDWFTAGPNDVGITVRTAVLSLRCGTPWDRAARRAHEILGHMTAGNGSLMRCAPIGLRYLRDPAERRRVSLQESCLTHFDPLAGFSCAAFNDLVGAASAAASAGELREKLPAIAARSARDDPRVAAALRLAETASTAEVQASGFVLDTLTAAVWAVLRSSSFEDAVVTAVNLGDDADTVGALAGALAGAIHGEAAIPDRWASALAVHARVLAAADGLADEAGIHR